MVYKEIILQTGTEEILMCDDAIQHSTRSRATLSYNLEPRRSPQATLRLIFEYSCNQFTTYPIWTLTNVSAASLSLIRSTHNRFFFESRSTYGQRSHECRIRERWQVPWSSCASIFTYRPPCRPFDDRRPGVQDFEG